MSDNIVVEIQSKENARLINLLCKNAQCVACPELVGRLMIQSTRGLHQVMTNVLGFDGSEFYFSKWPKLVGCTSCVFFIHDSVFTRKPTLENRYFPSRAHLVRRCNTYWIQR